MGNKAACRGLPTAQFFAVGTNPAAAAQTAAAKAVCAGCAVREPCLSFALAAHLTSKIFSGLTEDERRPLSAPSTELPSRGVSHLSMLTLGKRPEPRSGDAVTQRHPRRRPGPPTRRSRSRRPGRHDPKRPPLRPGPTIPRDHPLADIGARRRLWKPAGSGWGTNTIAALRREGEAGTQAPKRYWRHLWIDPCSRFPARSRSTGVATNDHDVGRRRLSHLPDLPARCRPLRRHRRLRAALDYPRAGSRPVARMRSRVGMEGTPLRRGRLGTTKSRQLGTEMNPRLQRLMTDAAEMPPIQKRLTLRHQSPTIRPAPSPPRGTR